MSINVSIGFQIPTNVVEVGNEITSDQLGAIGAASTPSAANPFVTQTWVGTQGFIGDAPSDGQLYGRINGGWNSVPNGTKSFIKASDYVTYGAYTVQASDFGNILLYDVSGGLTFDFNNSYPDDKELIIFVGAGSGGAVSPNIWNFTGSYGPSMFTAYCWIRVVQHQGYLYIA